MTLSEFQSMVHQLYQGDTASPSSTDEDWEVRAKLLEVSINIWAAERGVQWRELWTIATGTTSLGTTISLAGVTDFKFPGGFLKIKLDGINWSYIPIYEQAKADLYKNSTTGTPSFAWITGNKKTGFTINLSFTVAAGLSWELSYYKDPFIPSVAANIIEMSDPMFAIYFVLSKLHENDGEGDRATLAFSIANEKLGAMRLANTKVPNYQDNAVEDHDSALGGGGFGE